MNPMIQSKSINHPLNWYLLFKFLLLGIKMNQRIKLHALSVSLVALSSGWVNAAEVNLYTTREPVLIQPLLEEFNQKQVLK